MYNYINEKIKMSEAKRLCQKRKFSKAEKIYLQLIKDSDRKSKFPLFALAKLKIRFRKYNEAKSLLHECIKIDFKDCYAKLELSKIYVKENKYKEAKNLLKECIELDSKNLHARLELGKLYVKENKLVEAENLFKEYINLDPKGLHPRLELGKLYVLQNKLYEAENLFKEYINLDSKGLHPRLELGKLYVLQNKLIEAENLFKECIKIDSKDVHSRLELGNLYIMQNKLEEAEKVFLSLKNKQLLLEELAIVYIKTGREEEAKKLYNKIYNIDFDNELFDYNNRLTHIKKHQKNNLKKSIHGVFNYDAEMLINYAMKNKKDKKTNYFGDVYQIPYKNCGYQGGRNGDYHSYDYLILVLFPGTENIITMYPSDKKFEE